jgi:hypothetical protein
MVHFGAANFLGGLLIIMKDCGFRGLVLVLDEVETLQRMRSDARERGLNALRQIIDEIDAGRFPGLYLIVNGTPAFFDGPQGIQRLPPLAQRLHVDFATDARFDNPRAVQVRLAGFDLGTPPGPNTSAAPLFFAALRVVVVDEAHAFASDDRGWHLLALLERLDRLTGPSSATSRVICDHW